MQKSCSKFTRQGFGRDLAKQIDDVLANHEVVADQIESTVTDGAYHHDSIPKYLEELWELEPGDVHLVCSRRWSSFEARQM